MYLKLQQTSNLFLGTVIFRKINAFILSWSRRSHAHHFFFFKLFLKFLEHVAFSVYLDGEPSAQSFVISEGKVQFEAVVSIELLVQCCGDVDQ